MYGRKAAGTRRPGQRGGRRKGARRGPWRARRGRQRSDGELRRRASSPPAPRGSAPASAPPLPPWVRWLCLLGWVDFFLHNKVVVMLILYGLLVCFRVCRCTACTLVHSNFAKKFSLFVHLCELTLHICWSQFNFKMKRESNPYCAIVLFGVDQFKSTWNLMGNTDGAIILD